MKALATAAALWLVLSPGLRAQNFVLLQTGGDGKTAVSGDKTLLAGAYPPASTFKILIAWAALKEGVATPETPHLCADRGGKETGMGEAMYFSSNDYFRWLASRLDRGKFDALIRESGWGGKDFKAGIWLESGPDGTERGGELKVTVEQVHALSRQLLEAKSGPVAGALKKVMRRPWNDAQSRVYGKSGAWGGAVWMTGYYDAEKAEDRKAVTVFVPYGVPEWKPAREKAMREFYRCLGVPEPAVK